MKRVAILYLLITFSAFILNAQERGTLLTSDSDKPELSGLYSGSFALLIGVSEYSGGFPDLKGVAGEINLLKEALQKEGFQVYVVMNPGRDSMDVAIRDFMAQFGQDIDNRLFIFFAGHGYTDKKAHGVEIGYLCPADAPNPAADIQGFQKQANDLGLFDLSGNVYEWCYDWYDPKYYLAALNSINLYLNPEGPKRGELRVIRGGSWQSYSQSLIITSRQKQSPFDRGGNTGFRVVSVN